MAMAPILVSIDGLDENTAVTPLRKAVSKKSHVGDLCEMTLDVAVMGVCATFTGRHGEIVKKKKKKKKKSL